jgi:hypothetical protein
MVGSSHFPHSHLLASLFCFFFAGRLVARSHPRVDTFALLDLRSHCFQGELNFYSFSLVVVQKCLSVACALVKDSCLRQISNLVACCMGGIRVE